MTGASDPGTALPTSTDDAGPTDDGADPRALPLARLLVFFQPGPNEVTQDVDGWPVGNLRERAGAAIRRRGFPVPPIPPADSVRGMPRMELAMQRTSGIVLGERGLSLDLGHRRRALEFATASAGVLAASVVGIVSLPPNPWVPIVGAAGILAGLFGVIFSLASMRSFVSEVAYVRYEAVTPAQERAAGSSATPTYLRLRVGAAAVTTANYSGRFGAARVVKSSRPGPPELAAMPSELLREIVG
ncbi:MAG TPA: hypothetical protein VJQ43_04065 [Thermoplasmata archaeon]|nr:hypothetical protein [Thermoplasmata archaeon]